MAKLTESDIVALRDLYATGEATMQDIARLLDAQLYVDHRGRVYRNCGYVQPILKRKLWRHVPPTEHELLAQLEEVA